MNTRKNENKENQSTFCVNLHLKDCLEMEFKACKCELMRER